jgi:hypothetical protein
MLKQLDHGLKFNYCGKVLGYFICNLGGRPEFPKLCATAIIENVHLAKGLKLCLVKMNILG